MSHQFLAHQAGDAVAVAVQDLEPGAVAGAATRQRPVEGGRGCRPGPARPQVALRDVAEGEEVIEYGVPIGRATAPIERGRLRAHPQREGALADQRA